MVALEALPACIRSSASRIDGRQGSLDRNASFCGSQLVHMRKPTDGKEVT
jgi:hypothetical protein